MAEIRELLDEPVLIVDEQPARRERAAAYCEELGLRAMVAEDFVEAEDLLRYSRPFLLLSRPCQEAVQLLGELKRGYPRAIWLDSTYLALGMERLRNAIWEQASLRAEALELEAEQETLASLSDFQFDSI